MSESHCRFAFVGGSGSTPHSCAPHDLPCWLAAIATRLAVLDG